ncbi:uncharacterized protein LOC135213566 [Macrobrachium nipponense]|uniref:uncharacterized protein LOC135213566 n=1 Tax=Macrobrachium nipponense TaxID=159736 RepID=UPI0030C83139
MSEKYPGSEERKYPLPSPDSHPCSEERRYSLPPPESRPCSEEKRYPLPSSERLPYSEESRYPLPSSERQPHSKEKTYPLPLSEKSRSSLHGSSSWSPMNTRKSRSPEHYPERDLEDRESHYNLEETPWSKIGSALEAFTESNRRIRKQCQKERDPISQDALVGLFSTHARECELYLDKPDAHPDYFKEYRLFLDKKRDFIMKLGGDPGTYDYIKEWGKIWPSRLYDLFQKSWEVKKKECLSMISSKRKRSSSSSSSSRSPTPERVTKLSKNMASKPKKFSPKLEKKEALEDTKGMIPPRLEARKLREPNEQSQSVPYGEKVSSSQKLVKKKVVKIVEVLGILAYMKDKLGVLGVPVRVLYEKAVEMEKKGLNPNTLLEDEETGVLFATLSDKLNSLIKGGDGSAIQKAIIQEAHTLLLGLITEIDKIKRKDDTILHVNVAKIARLTKGKTISDTITNINYFLAYEGYSNVSKEDLENFYTSVKDEQLKFTESASSSQSNRFLSSPSGFDRAEQKTVESKIPGQGTKSSPSRDVGFSKLRAVKAFTSKFDTPVELDEEFFTGQKFLRPSDSVDNSRTEVTLKSTYVPHKHALPPPAPVISGIHNSSVLLKNSSSQSAQNPFCRTPFHSLQNSKQ